MFNVVFFYFFLPRHFSTRTNYLWKYLQYILYFYRVFTHILNHLKANIYVPFGFYNIKFTPKLKNIKIRKKYIRSGNFKLFLTLQDVHMYSKYMLLRNKRKTSVFSRSLKFGLVFCAEGFRLLTKHRTHPTSLINGWNRFCSRHIQLMFYHERWLSPMDRVSYG